MFLDLANVLAAAAPDVVSTVQELPPGTPAWIVALVAMATNLAQATFAHFRGKRYVNGAEAKIAELHTLLIDRVDGKTVLAPRQFHEEQVQILRELATATAQLSRLPHAMQQIADTLATTVQLVRGTDERLEALEHAAGGRRRIRPGAPP